MKRITILTGSLMILGLLTISFMPSINNVEVEENNFVYSTEGEQFINNIINSKGVSESEAIRLKERVEYINNNQPIPERLKLEGIDGLTLEQIEKNHKEVLE